LVNVVIGIVAMEVIAFAFSFLAKERERRKENVRLAQSFLAAGIGAAIVAGSTAHT
jgi:hypothetical protein